METLLEDYKRKISELRRLQMDRQRDGLLDEVTKRRLGTKISMIRSFLTDIERAIAREEERKSITH